MTVELPPEFMSDYAGAVFGGDNRMYRYLLWRRWSPRSDFANASMLLVIMLNPSTADYRKDDPTMRRVIGFTKAWGFDGVAVANLFAFRSKDPADLYTASNPAGPDNAAWLAALLAGPVHNKVLVAWGALTSQTQQRRAVKVLDQIRAAGRETVCLERTLAGYPKHPLYVAAAKKPMPYTGSHEDEAAIVEQARAIEGKTKPKRRSKSKVPV